VNVLFIRKQVLLVVALEAIAGICNRRRVVIKASEDACPCPLNAHNLFTPASIHDFQIQSVEVEVFATQGRVTCHRCVDGLKEAAELGVELFLVLVVRLFGVTYGEHPFPSHRLFVSFTHGSCRIPAIELTGPLATKAFYVERGVQSTPLEAFGVVTLHPP